MKRYMINEPETYDSVHLGKVMAEHDEKNIHILKTPNKLE